MSISGYTRVLVVVGLWAGLWAGCRQVAEPSRGESRQLGETSHALVERPATAGSGSGPIVTVTNPYTDPVVGDSPGGTVVIMDVPRGTPLTFCWTATASPGAPPIDAYRYGWDILDVADPEQWEIPFTTSDGSDVCAPERSFQFGVHTFAVQVRDVEGQRTLVFVKVNVLQQPPSVDIMPGTCRNPLSPRKQGVVQIAIPGTVGIDVTEIDVSSVALWVDGKTLVPASTRIADVARPVINGDRCECPDGGADGVPDLVMTVRAPELISLLGTPSKGEQRDVGVSGELSTGRDFLLVDCVTIVGRTGERPKPEYPPRDDTLRALESAYNTRNLEIFSSLIDQDFVFYFGARDVGEGNVPVAQWDRVAEIAATRDLFDGFARAGFAVNPSGEAAVFTEEATWGSIKYVGRMLSGPREIDLSLVFPPGDETWTTMAPDPSLYPDEIWYEKVVDYHLIVHTNEVTLVTGGPIRASFVVRWVNDGHDARWRIISWRDDI